MTFYSDVFSLALGVTLTATVGTALIQVKEAPVEETLQRVELSEQDFSNIESKDATSREDTDINRLDGRGEAIDNGPDNDWMFLPTKPPQVFDIDICDGQGGLYIAEEDETKRGAFTVANLNDSDADGKIDKDDDDVDNDPDLVVVTVYPPFKKVNAKTFSLTVSKSLRVWDDEDKTKEVKARVFPIPTLERTFYIEATATSDSMRDLTITATCAGYKDEVKLTAIWVKYKSCKNALKETLWKDCATLGNKASPSEDRGTRDSENELYKVFQKLFQGTFGRTGFAGKSRPNIGHGIGFEFQVFPTGVGKGPDSFVKFDVTRQKENYVAHKGGYVLKDEFPKDDTPNDEAGDENPTVNDEDNSPENDRIYSIDKPLLRTPYNETTKLFFGAFVMQANFKEYVRVRFDGKAFSNVDIGSRCSDKKNWHCRFAVAYKPSLVVGREGDWSFVPETDKRYAAYKPFSCDLEHKALTKTPLK
ncbi:MAG: hypothetical protein P1V97_08275 [Planctomycetota bacterium]|nr:hypothetical protein [Planctomycetota bacterium]